MKKLKKLSALLITVAMLATSMVACSSEGDKKDESSSSGSKSESSSTSKDDSEESKTDSTLPTSENVNLEGYPIGNIDLVYDVTHKKPVTDLTADPNEKEIFKMAEEATGVHINWNPVNETGFDEQFNLLLASGSGLPDGVFAWLQEHQVAQNSSKFYEITPEVFEAYAPNIYNGMVENVADGIDSLKKADGKIYSLPTYVWSSNGNQASGVTFINKKYIEDAGLEMPSTVNGLYDVLVALKDSDYNGNGQADEIPFVFAQANWAAKLQNMSGFWGMAGRTLNNDAWFGTVRDGKYELNIDQQCFRDYLTEMHKWYDAGLINIDGFSLTAAEYESLRKTGVHAMFSTWCPDNDEHRDEWVMLPMLEAEGYEGQAVKSGETGYVTACKNGFSIMATCEEPLGLLRWWDWQHKDSETKRISRDGAAGAIWIQNEDGTATVTSDPSKYTTGVTNDVESYHTDGMRTFGAIMFPEDVPQPDPNVYSDDLLRVGIVEYYQPYFNTEFIPITPAPADRLEDFALTKTEIEKFVDNFSAVSVTEGITDEQWEKYLSDLKGYGIDEWVQYYQDYCDGWV